MSHNITGKCKDVSIVDLEDKMVQKIATEAFDWHFLGKGEWQAFSGQKNVQADMLVAVPISQGSPYAQKLTPQQKEQMGLKGEYSVLAVTKGKTEQVKGPVTPGKPAEKPKEGIAVTMDDFGKTGGERNVDVFMKNATKAVNASRIIKKTNGIMSVLGKAIAEGKAPPGAKIVGPGAIQSIVIGAMKTGGKVTIRA